MTTEADNVVPEDEMARRRYVATGADRALMAWRALAEVVTNFRKDDIPTAEWVEIAIEKMSPYAQDKLGDGGASVLPMVVEIVDRLFDPDATPVDPMEAIRVGAGLSNTVGLGDAIGLLVVLAPKLLAKFVGNRAEEPALPPIEEDLSADAQRIRNVIGRLFADAPKLENVPDQAPAIECHLVLKTGQQLQGVLSTTPEGTLRMMTPNNQIDPRTRKPMGPPVMVETFFDYEQVSAVAMVREVTMSAAPDSPIITPP